MLRALTVLLGLCGAAQANGFLVDGPAPLPPIRLKSHRVTADVKDRVANVVVEQVFFNHSARALEGTYLFPLPRDAAVGEFAMTMGDTLVKGEVIEAERARRIYHAIVRDRRDPGLLEYVGRGLFRARVFPIEPQKELRIRLTYRQVLEEKAGTVEFRYPLASDRLNHAPVESVAVDLRFESSVDLKGVYSPSHRVRIGRHGERSARVTYEGGRHRAARDLRVFFGRSPDAVGFTMLSSKPDARDGTFLTVLAPRLKLEAGEIVPKDVVYVVDVSGSMRGRKLVQAKLALAQAVRLLRPQDRFNLLAFSSDWSRFRPALVAPDLETVHAAEKWIDRLAAAGGTALEAALSHSLRLGTPERLFLVVLITDGRPTIGITGADDILARLERANRARARVFPFGVGEDLDVALLDRIAEATGGEREYVREDERIDEVTARFFLRVDRPVLRDLELELDAGLTQVYPRRIRDLYAGGQIVLLGRYARPGPVKIRLTGRRLGKKVVYEYEGRLAGGEQDAYLERLWAHRKVAFLLDAIRLHGPSRELVDEVVALATRHRILTPYTAGLVVEPGARRAPAPIAFASGRGGFRAPGGGRPGQREPSDPDPPPPNGLHPSGPNTPAGPPAPADVSRELKRRKAEAVAEREGHLQTAAGKTFRRDERGRWIDLDWDGEGEPQRIEAYSDAYFDLIETDDRVARYLAVGERVVFRYHGRLYEIVPPEKA